MKRIFIAFLTGIFIYTIFVFQTTEVYATEDDEPNFTIVCNSGLLTDYSEIEFAIYDVEPVYDENNVLTHYNHSFKFNIEMEEINSYSFIKPSEMILIRPVISSLPAGYGIDQSSVLISNFRDKVIFNIESVDSASISSSSTGLNARLFSENGVEIYADYELELVQSQEDQNDLTQYALVYVGSKTFNCSFQTSLENQNEAEFAFENASELQEYSIPSYSANSRVIVTCDNMESDYSQDLINCVQAQAILIDEFLTSEDELNLPFPISDSDNKLYIEIETEEDSDLWGETDVLNYQHGYTRITLHCNKILTSSSFSSNSLFMMELYAILAHEMCHCSLYRYICINNNLNYNSNFDITQEFYWLNEAFSCFAGYEYIVNSEIFQNGPHNLIPIKSHYSDYLTNCSNNQFNNEPENVSIFYSYMFLMGYLYERYSISFLIGTINNLLCMNSLDTLSALKSELNKQIYEKNFNEIYNEFSKDIIDVNRLNILNKEFDNFYVIKANLFAEVYDANLNKNKISFDISLSSLSTKYIFLIHSWCNDYNAYSTIEVANKENLSISYIDKNASTGWSVTDINYTKDLVTIPYRFDSTNVNGLIITNYGDISKEIKVNTTIMHVAKAEEDTPINLVQCHNYESFETDNKFYVEFIPTKSTTYHFNLAVDGNLSKRFTVNLLDWNFEQVTKYGNCDEDVSFDITFSTDFAVGLLANKPYYIEVVMNKESSLIQRALLTISQTHEEIDLRNFQNFIYESTTTNEEEKILKINVYDSGSYKIKFEYLGEEDVTFTYYISSYYNGRINRNFQSSINNVDNQVENNVTLQDSRNQCIILANVQPDIDYKITFTRNINQNVSLFTDPNSNVTVGSEVRYNNGAYYGTTITAGFSRCIYIEQTSLYSSSRLDYSWTSSNPDAAIVSPYGTVVTKQVQEQTDVYISCTYKNNYYYVGYIVITVLPDTSDTRSVGITVDKRSGDNPAGTEVTVLGGQPGARIMHEGYTRFISFVSNNPTDSYQDFIWTSSNPEVATVSIYGTITAISAGTVTITGVYKNNPNFVAEIQIQVYRSFEMTYD